MYFLDLSDLVSEAENQSDLLNRTEGIWEEIYDRMEPTETLWVVAPNDYRDGQLWPVAMLIADFARKESNLVLKNTITVHEWSDRDGDMESAYDEILFFVRDKREYQFHKNKIRVAHVYQGNEWGGEREEGDSGYHDTKVKRYNPDGKDPGNVWLDEDRMQTDNQEVDEVAPIPFAEAIRRCILAGSREDETVYQFEEGDMINSIVVDEGRKSKTLELSELHRKET